MTRLDSIAYSSEFFDRQREGSFRSALRVLPHVFEIVSPRSIVDVGCGVGTWLAASQTLGVADVCGIDGDYVDRHALQIPPACFRAVDLNRPFTCERTFDLALCLEVGEHLPEACAAGLVDSLTRLAPVVLFSAAIPQQSGDHHVNEQWQQWWVEQFARKGFVAVDCIRHRIWNDPSVEWWYAQNILLMVREETAPSMLPLRDYLTGNMWPYTLVHPRAYLERLAMAGHGVPNGVRDWLALAPRVIRSTSARIRLLLTRRTSS